MQSAMSSITGAINSTQNINLCAATLPSPHLARYIHRCVTQLIRHERFQDGGPPVPIRARPASLQINNPSCLSGITGYSSKSPSHMACYHRIYPLVKTMNRWVGRIVNFHSVTGCRSHKLAEWIVDALRVTRKITIKAVAQTVCDTYA